MRPHRRRRRRRRRRRQKLAGPALAPYFSSQGSSSQIAFGLPQNSSNALNVSAAPGAAPPRGAASGPGNLHNPAAPHDFADAPSAFLAVAGSVGRPRFSFLEGSAFNSGLSCQSGRTAKKCASCRCQIYGTDRRYRGGRVVVTRLHQNTV